MIKNLSGGAVINYGPNLPQADSTYDGTLYFKTVGEDSGLYLFGFSQDTNTATLGDQTGQEWMQIKATGLFVDINGDQMHGDLTMSNGALNINSNNFGVSNGALPMTFINSGDTIWKKTSAAGGTELMRLTAAGELQIGGNKVWHTGNDGASSGLDADLLDGQDSAYYRNAANLNTGTLPAARLPFIPVQQGGGANQLSNKVHIGWSGNRLFLTVDSTDFANVWPMSIDGAAATANYANSAGSATTAATATTAQTANSVSWSGVQGRPTSLSSFTNDMNFVTSTSGGFIGNAVNTWQKSSDNANRFYFTSSGITNFASPTGFQWTGGASQITAMSLDGAGNLVATGDITAFSDERLKKDVAVIPNALEKAVKIRGVTFTRTDSGERSTGVIAQEVEEVLPQVVKKQIFDGMKSVAYGNMVGLLLEAIKDLKRETNWLRYKLAKLKDHVDDIEERTPGSQGGREEWNRTDDDDWERSIERKKPLEDDDPWKKDYPWKAEDPWNTNGGGDTGGGDTGGGDTGGGDTGGGDTGGGDTGGGGENPPPASGPMLYLKSVEKLEDDLYGITVQLYNAHMGGTFTYSCGPNSGSGSFYGVTVWPNATITFSLRYSGTYTLSMTFTGDDGVIRDLSLPITITNGEYFTNPDLPPS